MHKKSQVLRIIRRELENGNLLIPAIIRSGLKSDQTLRNWREKRPRIDRYISACLNKSDRKRIAMVEDAQFKAAINGSTKAQEFFLTNRASDRWKRAGDVNVSTVVLNKMGTNGSFSGEDREFADGVMGALRKKLEK